MNSKAAIMALESLAQETRLSIFKLLVRKGPNGLPAGEIALALEVPGPTLSFHLAHLTRAGLLSCRRESRSLIYSVHFEGMRDLLQFLTKDCCQGRPEFCREIALASSCGNRPGSKTRKLARATHD